jgi:hypothetical protein
MSHRYLLSWRLSSSPRLYPSAFTSAFAMSTISSLQALGLHTYHGQYYIITCICEATTYMVLIHMYSLHIYQFC